MNGKDAMKTNTTEKRQVMGRPAKHGEVAKGMIVLRTTLERKARYVRAARGRPLAEWITQVLDAAAP